MNEPTTSPLDQNDRETLKNEIKAEAVKEAQDALIKRLAGDKPAYSWEEKGKKAPADYDELFEEIDKKVVKPDQVSEIVKRELEADRKSREEAETQREEASRKKQVEDIEAQRKDFDTQWYDLVQKGKMPAIAPELQERINKGDKLSKEEILGDDGLKARLDLAEIAQKTGKSAKLAYYEDFDQEQAGKNAPVLGGRPRAPQKESDDLQYEDVAKNRRKIFGF